MTKIIGKIIRYPLAVIIPVLLITIFFAAQIPSLEIDTNFEAMFPAGVDHEFPILSEEVQDGEFDYLVIAVHAEDPFQIEALLALHEVMQEISALELYSTRSVNPFDFAVFVSEGRRIWPVTPSKGGKPPSNQEELELFRIYLLNDPFAVGNVVSPDGKTLAVLFHQEFSTSEEEFYVEKVRESVRKLEPFYDVHIIGTIFFALTAKEYLLNDIVMLLGISILLMVLLFYFGFRSVRSVLLPLIIVITGLIWSLGAMSLMNYSLTVIAVSLPPIILALGSSYTIHLLNQYVRDTPVDRDTSKASWMISGVKIISLTILVAGITTIIGFSSLLFSNIEQIRHFGFGSIIGIASCIILSISLLPAALSLLPAPKHVSYSRVMEGRLSALTKKIGPHVQRRYVYYIVAAAVLFSTAVLTYDRIATKTDFLEYYPDQDQLVIDTKFIFGNLGSFQEASLVLTAPTDKKDFFLDPEVLKKVYEFEQKLAGHKDVSYHASFASYIAYIFSLTSGENRIPDTRGLIIGVNRIFRLANMDKKDTGGFYISQDNTEMSILLRFYDGETKLFLYDEDLKNLIIHIIDLTQLLPEEVEISMSGWSLRFAHLADVLKEDQNTSLVISSLGVALVTMVVFFSIPLGLLALIPLAVGLCITYICMAVFNIPMDMSSAMMASIAIGVGVDDAVHFLIHYKEKRLSGLSIDTAVTETIAVTGRPIILTTVALVAGLLILMVASFKPVAFFGVLISLALTGACLGTVLVLPSWLILFHKLKLLFHRKS